MGNDPDRYAETLSGFGLGAEDLAAWAASGGLPLLGVDNLPGSVPLETYELPRACVLLFGQEGPGLSEEARRFLEAARGVSPFALGGVEVTRGALRELEGAHRELIESHLEKHLKSVRVLRDMRR